MPEEMIERACRFFRLGANAAGCISMYAFFKVTGIDARQLNAIASRGDWIRLADALEFEVAPTWRASVQVDPLNDSDVARHESTRHHPQP